MIPSSPLAVTSSIARRSILKLSPWAKFSSHSSRCFYSSSALRKVSPIELHTEWIVPAGAQGTVKNRNARGDDENYTILFMHGLLGNGRNLKTFARKLVEQQSSNHGSCRGGIVMDLRGHGASYQSQKKDEMGGYCEASSFLDCARDIHHTLEKINDTETISPTSVLVGHSFGGRLALEYAANVANNTPADNRSSVKAVWLLDTVPGQANETVDKVLESVTKVLEDRSEDIANGNNRVRTKKEIVQVLTDPPHNIDLPTAQWLAMSYDEKSGDNFGFDNNLVTRLKPEFASQDFMGLLQKVLQSNQTDDEDAINTHVHIVRGGKNPGWSIPILSELEKLKMHYPTTFHVHVLQSAGHNVHVDDLSGLVKLFAGTK